MTSDGTIWDEIAAADEHAGWIKFDIDGQEVEGEVTSLRTHTFPATATRAAQTVPVIGIDGREWTASNVDARAKVVAARPEVGDRIKVRRAASVPNKHGGKSVLFDVSVVKAPAAQPTDAPF